MKISLNRSLYRLTSVREAAKAFEGLADIEIRAASEEVIEVKVTPTDDEVAAVVADEFLNHALVQTISDRG